MLKMLKIRKQDSTQRNALSCVLYTELAALVVTQVSCTVISQNAVGFVKTQKKGRGRRKMQNLLLLIHLPMFGLAAE